MVERRETKLKEDIQTKSQQIQQMADKIMVSLRREQALIYTFCILNTHTNKQVNAGAVQSTRPVDEM